MVAPIYSSASRCVFQRDYNNLQDLFAKIAPETKRELRDARKQDKLDIEERKRREQHQADSAAAVNNPSTARRDTTRRPATSQ